MPKNKYNKQLFIEARFLIYQFETLDFNLDLLKYRNDVAIDNVDAKKIINQLWNYIWDLEDVEKGLIVPSEVRHVDFSDIKSKLFEYNLIAGKYQKESGKSLLLSK